jgi:hypothetical protein
MITAACFTGWLAEASAKGTFSNVMGIHRPLVLLLPPYYYLLLLLFITIYYHYYLSLLHIQQKQNIKPHRHQKTECLLTLAFTYPTIIPKPTLTLRAKTAQHTPH